MNYWKTRKCDSFWIFLGINLAVFNTRNIKLLKHEYLLSVCEFVTHQFVIFVRCCRDIVPKTGKIWRKIKKIFDSLKFTDVCCCETCDFVGFCDKIGSKQKISLKKCDMKYQSNWNWYTELDNLQKFNAFFRNYEFFESNILLNPR